MSPGTKVESEEGLTPLKRGSIDQEREVQTGLQWKSNSGRNWWNGFYRQEWGTEDKG